MSLLNPETSIPSDGQTLEILKYRNERRWHVLLLPILIAGTFGPGWQSVPSLCWIHLILLLVYSRHVRKRWLAVLFLVMSVSVAIAYLGAFNEPSNDWNLENIGYVCAVAPLLVLPIFVPILLERIFSEKFNTRLIHLIFPGSFTAFLLILLFLSPVGDLAMEYGASIVLPGAVLGSAGVSGVLSAFGLSGVNLLMSVCAEIIASFVQSFEGSSEQDDEEETQQQTYGESAAPRRQSSRLLHRRKLTAIVIFLIVLTLIIIVFEGRLLSRWFFQKDLETAAPDTLSVGCVISENSRRNTSWTPLLAESADLLESGAGMVIWSEEAISVYGSTNETAFLSDSSTVAATYSGHVIVTYQLYSSSDSDSSKNMLAWLGPDGTVLARYQKRHPVPEVEPGVEAGTEEFPIIDTSYGLIGAAICMDFDFPQDFPRAGRQGVQLMLQPSWTWGPIGYTHTGLSMLRAIENGFTLVRCSSQGVSGVFGPYGEVYSQRLTQYSGSFIMYVPLFTHTWTLYPYIGDVVGWICLVVPFVALLGILIPKTLLRKVPGAARRLR